MDISAFVCIRSYLAKQMRQIVQDFSAGSLRVNIHQDVDPEVYFQLAERQNPKRSFLFVSRLLGKHIPVSPQKMRQSYDLLAAKIPIDLPAPIVFIGMAETAVALAAGIHRSYCARGPEAVLLTSTRHRLPGDLICEFKEDHSHATDHLLYYPCDEMQQQLVKEAKTLVLVDDEVTTGKTFCHLAEGVIAAGLDKVSQIYTVSLTDWCQSDLSDQIGVKTTPLSLISGWWQWQAKQAAQMPVLPKINIVATQDTSVSCGQNWQRLGSITHEAILPVPANLHSDQTYLVLGTGEFLWQPFLLAEKIANMGAHVFVSSTTRSPVNLGMAIRHKVEFKDNYGLGIANYCYNINPMAYDRIFVCCDTRPDLIDPAFMTYLQKAQIISYGQ